MLKMIFPYISKFRFFFIWPMCHISPNKSMISKAKSKKKKKKKKKKKMQYKMTELKNHISP